MSEQNCVFAYDDYFCRECVGDDVPPEEVIPVNLFDAVQEYPTCAKCGKEHRYMVLVDADAEPVPGLDQILLRMLETLQQLDRRLEQHIERLEYNTAAVERQTEVLSRPSVL
jgi:hypothetical protein